MKTLGWWLFWVLIQLVSLVLFVIGIPVIAVFALLRLWTPNVRDTPVPGTRFTERWVRWDWKGGKLTWLWGNDEDGIFGPSYSLVGNYRDSLQAFTWSALRNPVNNLRFVPGVSGPGRPLFRKFLYNQKYYFQAGWNGMRYPVLSGGKT